MQTPCPICRGPHSRARAYAAVARAITIDTDPLPRLLLASLIRDHDSDGTIKLDRRAAARELSASTRGVEVSLETLASENYITDVTPGNPARAARRVWRLADSLAVQE